MEMKKSEIIRTAKKRLHKLKHILYKYMKSILGILFGTVGNLFAVDCHKVMFFTFQNGYTCNPKYIHKELQRAYPGVKASWVVDRESLPNDLPETVLVVRRGTVRYYKELYTSRIWIDNALNVQKLPVRRKRNQFYLQTMHGSLGIKRIGTNASNNRMQQLREKKSAELTNVAISNSTFETEVYRTSFWRDACLIAPEEVQLVKENPDKCYIMELGHARSDVLIQSTSDRVLCDEIRRKVCTYFHAGSTSRFLLWAPTFEASTENLCQLDFGRICRALKERFGGNWLVISRAHPRDSKKKGHEAVFAQQNIADDVLDGSGYPDIQELMIAADFAVTNYSSWIFDYLLTGKPGMLFVPDLEKYRDSTGFYYPIESTPFPVVRDNEEAVCAIRDFDLMQYQNAVQEFVRDKGCVDDGNAARRIVNLIKMLLE